LPTFDYQQGKTFRGFLWTCYYRLAKRLYHEQRGGWPEGLELASEDAPLIEEAEFQEYVLSRACQVMKRRFEEKVWQAFVEIRLNQRSALEVEQLLGIKEATVWVYNGRVLNVLREELAGLID